MILISYKLNFWLIFCFQFVRHLARGQTMNTVRNFFLLIIIFICQAQAQIKEKIFTRRNDFFTNAKNNYLAEKDKKETLKFLNSKMLKDKFTEQELAVVREKILNNSSESSDQHIIDGSVRSLMPLEQVISDLRRNVEIVNSKDGKLKAYKKLYSTLNDELKKNILSPAAFEVAGPKSIDSNYKKIRVQLSKNPFQNGVISNIPSYYEQDCSKEIGYVAPISSYEIADNSNRCLPQFYSKNSLYNKKNFPLKYSTSCVKDQQMRGTCVSFATNAAIESILYSEKKKPYNLSEQFTYLALSVFGRNWHNRYNYGIYSSDGLNELEENNIQLELEKYWRYNGSPIISDQVDNEYPNSCSYYSGQLCTNYAFQSNEHKVKTGLFSYSWNYDAPAGSNSLNFEVTDQISFYDWLHVGRSLDEAIHYLDNGLPVILSFSADTLFIDGLTQYSENADNWGYVRYDRDEYKKSSVLGGHAVLLIGFISNDDLPEGVEPAAEKGYFIAKNSWGISSGDCGFNYLDYKWLSKRVTGLNLIEARLNEL